MKVMIPLDEERRDVCVSFGRAPFFLIYDTGSGLSECLPNPAAEASGGAGIQAAQFVVDRGADVLITIRCGENAAEVFKAAGMRILKALQGSAEANLEAFRAGTLEPLTRFHAGFHGVK